MCGIIIVVGFTGSKKELQKKLQSSSRTIRHRGPDWSGVEIFPLYGSEEEGPLVGFAHERLSIVDPYGKSQPLFSKGKKHVLCVNGEIYNHEELKEKYGVYNEESLPDSRIYEFSTKSDCESILSTYVHMNDQIENLIDGCHSSWIRKLDGQFSFGLFDKNEKKLLVARDPIGITPLYWGKGENGEIWIASEMKAIIKEVKEIEIFQPGNIMIINENLSIIDRYEYYKPKWYYHIPQGLKLNEGCEVYLPQIKDVLEKAVIKRLMCDVPYGILLSGGLDSSIVASIVSRYCLKRVETGRKEKAHFPTLHTFSIGIEGEGESPDLINSRKVAKFIGSIHHEFTFTIEEALHVLPQIVYHLETYDVTTIRASTPMFLLARRIKSMGIKMVLSGEGADEIFGGYLYFHKAPNRKEFHKELVRKVRTLHQYDCLRANKAMMAWGVETRVPFLDKDVLDVVMNVDPTLKMISSETQGIEKYILRKAFDDPDKPYLPHDILWRQKEQFSDGVGSKWIDGLKKEATNYIKSFEMEYSYKTRKECIPYNTPTTEEGFWYRCLFNNTYRHNGAEKTVLGGPSVACSSATATLWDEKWKGAEDPSGRAVTDVYKK